MDLSQVKLVVSDMDGTLLNTKGEVSPVFFELFNKLKSHGIHFVAASGRQYSSITNKLEDIVDDITIIAENGGIAKRGSEELIVTNLPSGAVNSCIDLLRKLEDVFVVLCGKNAAYIETQNSQFVDMFSEFYATYEIVDDLTKASKDDFLKIAVYHFDSSEKHVYPAVKHYEDSMQVKVSGQNWLDLSHPNANKGYALKMLQKQLGITKEETMVFGDYNNDLEMMELAHFSYAMENAHPNVVKVANFQTKSNDDYGVEFILEQLIAAKESSV
ncbi:HAD family hydrolase [Galbibacter sp. EGI 63066]|uniref:HAD family hydrolase n=1 Tax=Galbibacter sp. EGI 63066 TaxID=2993559 RepID=UPI00224951A1|nr:HAD family hydrolase [Galbibacter sp. EGI 63066]MCX2682040.1 HAD family hydrolase [Galbibacter sp. EGI 63066]